MSEAEGDVKMMFSDIDPNGHVNNLVYLRLFQDFRVALIKPLRSFFSATQYTLAIARLEMDYKKQTYEGQTLHCVAKYGTISKKSWTVLFEARLKDTNECVSSGNCVYCIVSKDSKKGVEIAKEPQIFRYLLDHGAKLESSL